jgi:hypothetical protein
MHDFTEIRPLSHVQEIEASFEVMKQLRPHLERDAYVETIRHLMESGYRLVAVVVSGRVEAVAGYRFGESLALLLDWLKREAAARGCRDLHLDSGVQRFDAHRFYLREQLDITSHHFRIGLR